MLARLIQITHQTSTGNGGVTICPAHCLEKSSLHLDRITGERSLRVKRNGKMHRQREIISRRCLLLCCTALVCFASSGAAHGIRDNVPRIAVMSAFAPEMSALKEELGNTVVHSINGVEFSVGTLQQHDVVLLLTGISVVNAAMTAQLALDRFNIRWILFSGIAGGVDPELNLGDVVIADRWGQYLEMLFAREVNGGWSKPAFFKYPFGNFGMMFPRAVDVRQAGAEPQTRFWFPVNETLLDNARAAATGVILEQCTAHDMCLEQSPRIVIGGSGVSGGAFVDNAAFRDYTFKTFGARVLDMESAAVAHVAWSNQTPFIAIRSLSDLAGGEAHENQMEIFLRLAAKNAASVVKALLRATPREANLSQSRD